VCTTNVPHKWHLHVLDVNNCIITSLSSASSRGRDIVTSSSVRPSVRPYVCVCMYVYMYTVSHKKCATLFLITTLAFLGWFIYTFIPVEMGRNTLQFTYLMAWVSIERTVMIDLKMCCLYVVKYNNRPRKARVIIRNKVAHCVCTPWAIKNVSLCFWL